MQQRGQDYRPPEQFPNNDFELNGMHRKTHVVEALLDYDVDANDTNPVDLRGYGLLGLIVPEIENAALTFYASEAEGGTYLPVCDATPAQVTIAASTGAFAVSSTVLDVLKGYRWVIIHTGADQTADRTFFWILKG